MDFKPKILVVDDEPPMLELLSEFAAQAGAAPVPLTSGSEAARRIDREKFDGFFLDWRLPDLSGAELVGKVRWSKSNSLCPIVVITALDEPDAMRQCFRAGVNFFLQKPVTADQIKSVLHAMHDLLLQERLRYQRVPLQLPVACKWQIGSFEQATDGESVNLSSTGMLVHLEIPPAPGVLIRLSFHLPGDLKALRLTAFVVREVAGQRVGLRFVNLTRDQRWRLIEFSRAALLSSGPESG